jgi:hypothetical protein
MSSAHIQNLPADLNEKHELADGCDDADTYLSAFFNSSSSSSSSSWPISFFFPHSAESSFRKKSEIARLRQFFSAREVANGNFPGKVSFYATWKVFHRTFALFCAV